MEEIIEEIVLAPIKEEEFLEYSPIDDTPSTNPLDAPVPPDDTLQALNRFCRLCLREVTEELVPLATSSVNAISALEMVRAVTGIDMVIDPAFPGRACMTCMGRLDQAYRVRVELLENDRILRSFVALKEVSVVEGLEAFKRGVLVEEIHLDEDAVEMDPEEEEVVESDEQAERKRQSNGRYNIEMRETKLDPNKCYICEEVFEDVEQVNFHLPKHVSMIPYSCELCEAEGGDKKKLTSLILLHRHFRMHAGSIQCPQCPFRTCTAAGLYNHMRYHSDVVDGKEFTCTICGLQIKSKRSFDNHMRNHKAIEESRFQCQYCEKKFATKPRLIRHERSHTNLRPFHCRYCSKDFTNETSLNAHERTHTGERGYQCEICDKTYRTGTTLKEHVATVHGDPEAIAAKSKKPRSKSNLSSFFPEPQACPVEGCSFSARSRNKFYNHKARHELRFQCTECPKRFPTRQRLEQHSFVHTGIKPFCCDLCGKSFRFQNSFNEHRDSHGDVRKYSCEICSMAFVRERTLKEHRLKHTDEKNYECRYCGKKFKYRADQSKHERTHIKKPAEVKVYKVYKGP